MSSLFDPTVQLGEMEVDGAMATKRVDAPAGRYKWQIKKYAVKKFEAKEPGKKDSYRLEIECEADANQQAPDGTVVKDLIGRDSFYARYSGWADLNAEGTAWDLGPGKNVALGAIRAAVGLNADGQKFKLGMLNGQVFTGELYYRPNDKDPEAPGFPEIRYPLPV